MDKKEITFKVNGKEVNLMVHVGESLLDVLRERLHLTSVKKGCEVGECGACTVLIDNKPFDSCIFLAVWAEGCEIRTAEGECVNGELSNVQKAFLEENAVQCGFCTPGFVMTATSLCENDKNYTREELKKELSGNMCRCTGYHNIVNAVEKALNNKHKCCGGCGEAENE